MAGRSNLMLVVFVIRFILGAMAIRTTVAMRFTTAMMMMMMTTMAMVMRMLVTIMMVLMSLAICAFEHCLHRVNIVLVCNLPLDSLKTANRCRGYECINASLASVSSVSAFGVVVVLAASPAIPMVVSLVVGWKCYV